jgi:[histone H3]-lysine27 N-trimethyltransferase EZH2
LIHAIASMYVPCEHEGPCSKQTPGCTCIANETMCEKFCRCSADCTRRWKGCNCSSRGCCSSNKCPCFAATRECDPDVCGNCGASTLLEDQRNLVSSRCRNVNLQYQLAKRVLVGTSFVSGAGAFLGEFARKGDFICEYAGEVWHNCACSILLLAWHISRVHSDSPSLARWRYGY